MQKKVKNIPFQGKVLINEDGTEIFRNDKKIKTYIVKTPAHKNGYACCSIEGKQRYIHRLVAETYVKNDKPISNKFVIHKDGNTLNNHYKNLIWSDKRDSSWITVKPKSYRGHSKISYDEAIKIAKRLDNGEPANRIAVEYGTSDMSINRIRKRYCKQTQKSPRYGAEIKAQVIKLCKTHKPADVARTTGLSYATVRKWYIQSQE